MSRPIPLCQPPLATLPDALRFRLLNDWQHDFPRVEEPFGRIAAQLGHTSCAVLAAYRDLQAGGVVSRIGPVFATRRVGASALVALAVTPGELDAVAARVSAVAEVNHNYEREHRYNLWFVVTAADAQRLEEVVAGIESDTGYAAIRLPMEEAYHIDLGFDLGGGAPAARPASVPVAGAPCALPGIEQALMRALQLGLPLVARPYAELGNQVGLSGAMVCGIIDEWLASGLLRRFGVVVRHHELGYTANAMCVWDVADERVGEIGRLLGTQPGVTLCYRRSRVRPHWPYNLFCMIHGKAREDVLATRAALAGRLGLDQWPHAVLFSRRRFKQRGACYLPQVEPAHV